MLHHSTGDLQHIQAAYRLNRKNYLKYSQLVRTFLEGKGKLSHLLSTGLDLMLRMKKIQSQWHSYRIQWQRRSAICIETTCPDDAVILKNYTKKDRIYNFLVSLNVEYDQVRVQILGKELPSLNETIRIIWAKESRKSHA